MAEYIVRNRNNSAQRNTISNHILGQNWTTRFVKRYQHLQTIIAQPLEQPRNAACTSKTFIKWFKVFCDNMEQYKPDIEDIYNVDETEFMMRKGEKMYVIVDKEIESTGYVGQGTKGEFLTVIECASAAGNSYTSICDLQWPILTEFLI